jgi:branched-subunit amino acid ABC-type transport system permease component
MESIFGFISPKILSQILVGLSRTVILFIVSSGLSLILGVLRIPNVAHGSLYMIGAFMAYTVSHLFGGGNMGFWMALVLPPSGWRWSVSPPRGRSFNSSMSANT